MTIDYSDLQGDEIQPQVKQGHKVRPMYLIRESEISQFRNSVIQEYGLYNILLNKGIFFNKQ